MILIGALRLRPTTMNKLLVDIHTHVYLPRYAAMLRARSSAPKIMSWLKDGKPEDRLLILDDEPSGGPNSMSTKPLFLVLKHPF